MLDILLLRSDFDEVVQHIRQIYISRNYLGLMSWLIDRAFVISPALKQNNKKIRSTMRKNKTILLKVLFEVNPSALLKIFSKNS